VGSCIANRTIRLKNGEEPEGQPLNQALADPHGGNSVDFLLMLVVGCEWQRDGGVEDMQFEEVGSLSRALRAYANALPR
jgi:hypothetical protein